MIGQQLTTAQLHTLGMADMSIKARDALMMQIGRSVFAQAMVRLLAELTEEQVIALNYAIEATDSFVSVMQYVEETYPRFLEYLRAAETDYVESLAADLTASRNV